MKYTLEKLNKMVEKANKNGDSLDLSSLTSIPEGFNPTVGGSLDLRSLTSIPEGFNPTVGGSLYLRSLTSIERNKVKTKKLSHGDYVPGKYLYCDGILTHVKREKRIGEYTYYIGKIPGRNVIFDGNNYAHCKSFHDGVIDLAFKKARERGAEQYKSLSLDSVVAFDDARVMYRVITGACQAGTQQFIDGLKEVKEKYTVKEIIELTQGHYGAETFSGFFENAKIR